MIRPGPVRDRRTSASRRAALLARRLWHGLVAGVGGVLVLSLLFSAVGFPIFALGVGLFLMVGDMAAAFPDRHTIRWYWAGSIAELAAIGWVPILVAVADGIAPWAAPVATLILLGTAAVDGATAWWLWRTETPAPPPNAAERLRSHGALGSQEPLSSPCS